MKRLPFATLCCAWLLCWGIAADADTMPSTAAEHVDRGNLHAQENQFFSALAEYQLAIDQGLHHPLLYRNLAITYSKLLLINDAITAMERAVALAPDSHLYQTELGMLYLANHRMEQARQALVTALKLNPGFEQAYYYLGEWFFQQEKYQQAWLAAEFTQQLGGDEGELSRKLRGVSKRPTLDISSLENSDICLRQILVSDRKQAEMLQQQITAGVPFDTLAQQYSTDSNGARGGYSGLFRPSELTPAIAAALAGVKGFAPPVIVETAAGFHLVQRLVPFNAKHWFSLSETEMTASAPETPGEKTPSVGNEEGHWLVHVGTFRDPTYAKDLQSSLARLGYRCFTQAQDNRLHVIAGRYISQKEAEAIGADLSRQGYDNFISGP